MTDLIPSVDEVFSMLEEHQAEMDVSLNLVPSEAAFSGLSKVPMLLDAHHRYFFNESGAPDRWTFRGAERLRGAETRLAVGLLQQMGKAEHVSVKPLSGLSAMTLAIAALAGPKGGCVVTIGPENGGHYATPSVARQLGFDVDFIRGPNPHEIDWDQTRAMLRKRRPRLVYVDQSHCLFPVDVAALTRVVREASPDAVVHVDCSHWMGFVLSGVFENPLDAGADSFGGSTHKTFPGPQKAVLLTRDPVLNARIQDVQDYLISSHHFASTLSLALALAEFSEFGAVYARTLLGNVTAFGGLLAQRGITMAAPDRGYSGGHQLWIDTEADGIEPRVASDRLASAGIRVNFMKGLPGFSGFGVRIGLNEASYQGLTPGDLPGLADTFVAAVFQNGPDSGELARRVAALRDKWRTRSPEPLGRAALLSRAARLVETALQSRYLGPVSSDGTRW